MKTSLPYVDTKPQGAADFYTAINATFRFIQKEFGHEGLIRYWEEMGREYFQPVTALWKNGGLTSVARYWRDFFAAEPGAEVEIVEGEAEVVLEVRVCPAISHLRKSGREIVPEFCEHCHYVSNAMGKGAYLQVEITGGNGSCRQRFFVSSEGKQRASTERIRRC